MYKLIKINLNMGLSEYNMYQDIPSNEVGSSNNINGLSFEEFKNALAKFIDDETKVDENLKTTTNRYLFYVNDVPIGEVGIRTTLNDFWINRGSQIFYKIKLSERNKGYGSKMLEMALKECKKLGMEQVGINCNVRNFSSKRIIEKNGGRFLFNYGESSRYIIQILEK